MSEWKLQTVAVKVTERLDELSDQKLPMEILKLEEDIASIVFDIEGIDYIATLMPIPRQRVRPSAN